MNVENSEISKSDIPSSYGFYHSFWNKSFDIEGNELIEKPKICGILSIGNYMAIQSRLNKIYEENSAAFELV
jgi:hypothetical protein